MAFLWSPLCFFAALLCLRIPRAPGGFTQPGHLLDMIATQILLLFPLARGQVCNSSAHEVDRQKRLLFQSNKNLKGEAFKILNSWPV